MLKKIRHFFKEYKQLGFVILAILIGAGFDITKYHTIAHWVLGVTAIINVTILLWGMFRDLREGSYGIDILAAAAIVTSVVLHEYWAGIIIVLMLTGGEALEDYAQRRAKTELNALLARKPKRAHVIRGRKTIDLTVNDVRVGDKLSILPGEVVPVDAVLIEGSSSFDESSLTGESLPVVKTVGDSLLSGSINLEGSIIVRAIQTAGDSQYQQIIKLVQGAASSQSPFVRLADRYSIPFSVMAFAIAGSTWFITGHAIRFLEVLVVATPCPLLLGAPVALISGMSRAARNGIIIKTGTAIERLAEIQTMAFDKTGTLTKGKPKVDEVKTFGSFTTKEVLAYAAGLEQSSNHVLATAIIEAAVAQNVNIPKSKQIKEDPGHGLKGRLQGKTIQVGRLDSLLADGVTIPKNFKPASLTQTATLVAINGELAGIISFVDEIRPESKKTLLRLTKAGIRHIMMVTGDNTVVAGQIAKKLGIKNVHAECLPVDKLRVIEDAEPKPVAFVGDGVNDAPVLAAADVGIALGARGSTAASESADVVILLDDVSKVADAVEIAKRTFFIAKQSILVGIFISLGLMVIFSTGKFKPIYGAVIQELVDVTVIFNALRAHGPFRTK